MTRTLVLAGTTEARLLVDALALRPDHEVVASLAGRTARPLPLRCTTRTGGFGGPSGLEAWLRAHGTGALVDATHPFAARMPHAAAAAATAAVVPRLRLLRPGWTEGPGDRWTRVPDLDAAADVVAGLGAPTALLTTGRQDLAPFAARPGPRYVLRSIDPPAPGALPGALVVLARGPFGVDDEVALLTRHAVDVLVTKDSGGDDAKLVAARRLALPVVVVDRPPQPEGPTVDRVDDALAWVAGLAQAG